MQISAVILAGGKAQRMGGGDKGWVMLAEKPLITHVLDRLTPQVDEILINANREFEKYATFGYQVISDSIDGHLGPLAGLHTALQHAKNDLVMTVPCDSPLLPNNLAKRLLQALINASADIAVVITNGRPQPVFSLCHKRVLPKLEAYLLNGGRKVGEWQQSLNFVEVPFDDCSEAFRNINTPEELANLERELDPLKIPTLGICAYGSDSGKTTLITQLIPIFHSHGVRVGVIKHAHHLFDIDHAGKDSFKIRAAGAAQTLVSSSRRWALMTEIPPENQNGEPSDLRYLVQQMDAKLLDIVLVEGYREANIPKIEVHRPSLTYPLLATNKPEIIAIATDAAIAETPLNSATIILDLNQPTLIAEFIINWLITQKTS